LRKTLAANALNTQDKGLPGNTWISSSEALMSEGERSQGPSSGMWLGIGALGIFLAGGCLLACLGLVGLGFALPAAQKAKQAARAEAEANEAQRQAAEAKARALAPPGAASDESPPTEGPTEPEQEETPANEGNRPANE
jgi:hypothetical protein